MKFSEMPYTRPDMEKIKAGALDALQKIENARSAAEVLAAYKDHDERSREINTLFSLAYTRHTIDTRDPFYEGENDYSDEVGPAVQELNKRVELALLRSPFRPELERELGSLLFKNLEISVRTMKPEIMELMTEENKLQSRYQKLCATALVEWEGAMIPLPKLGPYKQSTDRATRRRAFAAACQWLEDNREELDELYDKLVKNRDAQGKAMGYESYIPLAYDRLGRNCYGPREVSAFREQIARDMVPVAEKVRREQARRLGLDHLTIYDASLRFPDGNAIPQGSAEELLSVAHKMYRELSPETAEFADFLFGNELLDVLSKEGKAPGGYCTSFPLYKAPFIFSNFNGTSGDVDVLTHEAGHAFADYRSSRKGYLSDLESPTMEACECHSMSMEFLTAPWHEGFFGPQTKKYERSHCEDALTFIPYGCMVDEFQHRMFENPGLNPEERNRTWLELEKKYRPGMDYDGLPCYSRGALWQQQLHIYECPFYYIDYCMAQSVALQFWQASLRDREDAWRRYLAFVDAGGTKTFEGLVAEAGLKLPYAPGAIAEVAGEITRWLDGHPAA